MVLCLDIGNTNISIGIEINKQIVSQYRLATNPSLTEDEYVVKFKDILSHSPYVNTPIEGVIIASVVPAMDTIMEKTFTKYYNLKPMFVVPGIKSGIRIKIEHPKQLGADLLIGAVGAYHKYRGNLIIVDLGTATKLTVVTETGDFLGGIIAPGVMSSLASLVSSTAKLQHAPLQRPENIIGRDTVSSIQSGAIYGTAAMIDGLIAQLKKEIGEATVILTGGLGDVYHPVIETPHFFEPNILLEGLVIIYYKNKG
ncbi:MAG: type III pantothenate kinase [Bacilli bacterium]|nr:type III pantothenate kinase [Bacilli bacterium]